MLSLVIRVMIPFTGIPSFVEKVIPFPEKYLAIVFSPFFRSSTLFELICAKPGVAISKIRINLLIMFQT
jgi:hypothetical protein